MKYIINKTQQRFNKWSKKYDKSILQKVIFNDSHDMIIKTLEPILDTRLKILDVACGTGKFAFKITKQYNHIKVSGVDFSPKMIAQARKKLSKWPNSNIDFTISSADTIPHPDNSFDIVICTHAFHHFPNQVNVLKEMHRVLKPNGRLMIIDGCKDRKIGSFIFGCIVRRVEKNVHHMKMDEIKDAMYFRGFYRIKQKIFNGLIPLLLTVGIKC